MQVVDDGPGDMLDHLLASGKSSMEALELVVSEYDEPFLWI